MFQWLCWTIMGCLFENSPSQLCSSNYLGTISARFHLLSIIISVRNRSTFFKFILHIILSDCLSRKKVTYTRERQTKSSLNVMSILWISIGRIKNISGPVNSTIVISGRYRDYKGRHGYLGQRVGVVPSLVLFISA